MRYYSWFVNITYFITGGYITVVFGQHCSLTAPSMLYVNHNFLQTSFCKQDVSIVIYWYINNPTYVECAIVYFKVIIINVFLNGFFTYYIQIF